MQRGDVGDGAQLAKQRVVLGVAAADSAAAQSMPLPSAILAARLCDLSSGFTFHRFRKFDERTRHRHARGIGRRLAERAGQFLVGVAQLDAADDGLLFGRAER